MDADIKFKYVKLLIYSLAFIMLFVTWGALVWFGKKIDDPTQYIAYIHDALISLTAHVLTMINVSKFTEGKPK